jgi:pimeloyl-ACP methyl ester carboxylesterase
VSEYDGPADAPVMVCVHGYPDNQRVWWPVAARLADRFRVVTYDVRGHGDSDAPADRSGYLIDRLAADLAAVMDAVSPDRPVHLLAHDWGAIQTWAAVSGNLADERIASYASISGPSLDQAAAWLRGFRAGGLPGARARLTQLAASSYIWFFRVPWLPEAAWRSGAIDRLLARERPDGHPGVNDRINGLELYRANFSAGLRRPTPRPVRVPVQVIVPSRDVYVTPALAREAPAPYVADLTVTDIEGRHWVILDRPDVIAGLVAGFASGR